MTLSWQRAGSHCGGRRRASPGRRSIARVLSSASAELYFLLMIAWLNTFLNIGYIRPMTQLIPLAAIGIGADHLYELALKRGVVECEVGDVEQRQRTILDFWTEGGEAQLKTRQAYQVEGTRFVAKRMLANLELMRALGHCGEAQSMGECQREPGCVTCAGITPRSGRASWE